MVYLLPDYSSSLEELPEVNRVTKKRIYALIVISIFSAMLISSCTRSSSESTTAAQIGHPAPKFKLKDLEGKENTLDQYKGRVVVIDFWATWCGPCRVTMPMLENLQKEFAGSMVLLAIDEQEPKDVVAEYVWKQGIRSQVLLDETGSLYAAYGGDGIPMQVVIDKEGIVRHIHYRFQLGKTISDLRAEIQNLR
jgi:thiol-disulfide isomerase/thioredoxin